MEDQQRNRRLVNTINQLEIINLNRRFDAFIQWNMTQPYKWMEYVIWSNIDGPGRNYTKWSKPERERQIYNVA